MERRKDCIERHRVRHLDFAKVEDNLFTGRVICGNCEGAFRRKTWNSADENLKRRVYGSVIGNTRERKKLGVRINI